jgi:hypothetical protein
MVRSQVLIVIQDDAHRSLVLDDKERRSKRIRALSPDPPPAKDFRARLDDDAEFSVIHSTSLIASRPPSLDSVGFSTASGTTI